MPRVKRSASVIDEEPPVKKVAVAPPNREGKSGQIHARGASYSSRAGCLKMVGRRGATTMRPNGVTMEGKTAVRTCIRCSAHGKCCHSVKFLLIDHGRNLRRALGRPPRDNDRIKFHQERIRNLLGAYSHIFMPRDAKPTRPEEIKFREYSKSLGEAIDGFEALIESAKEDVGTGTGNDAAFEERCKDGLGLVKFMFGNVREYSPKRFTNDTMKGMGFI